MNSFSAEPPGDDGGARPPHNQSVLKAIALLRCFVDNPDGPTLTELSRRTGINVSTAHRMLQTLTYGGVLHRAAGSERYTPGPVLMALAGATYSTSGYEPALMLLRDLAEQTGESVSLGIRDGTCAIVLLGAESTQPLRFGHPIGSRIPLHALAMGKVLLAFGGQLPADAVDELGVLRPLTPRTVLSATALTAELAGAAERGYAVASEEEHIGVRSLAVPVARLGEIPRTALSVQGPLGRLTDARLEELRSTLQDSARLLSQLPALDRLASAGSPT